MTEGAASTVRIRDQMFEVANLLLSHVFEKIEALEYRSSLVLNFNLFMM